MYGDPKVHPQPESYWGNVNPIGPRACYDEGKRVAETMMYAYKAQVRFWRLGLCVYVCVVGWFGWGAVVIVVAPSDRQTIISPTITIPVIQPPTNTNPNANNERKQT